MNYVQPVFIFCEDVRALGDTQRSATMRLKALCLFIWMLAPLPALAEQGVVYSYIKDGTRYYTAKPPADVPYRTINYSIAPRSAQPPAAKLVVPRPYYYGSGCTYDCSGHEAGARWAERRGIERPDECSGNSNSFIEGCEEYAQEVQRNKVESGECDDEDGDEMCDY